MLLSVLGGEHKQWHSSVLLTNENIPAIPLGLFLFYSTSFKLWLFVCVPGYLALAGSQLAGWLGCPDSAPICAIKVKREHKQWHLPAPLTMWSILQLPYHLTGFFKFWLFLYTMVFCFLFFVFSFCAPDWMHLLSTVLPHCSSVLGVWVPLFTICLTCHSVYGLSFIV